MNNKIMLSFIIFCYSNAHVNLQYRSPNIHQLQNWYLFKEINVAEKIIGVPNKDILRKSEEYYITAVCIDPSEKSLAIASCDKKVRILDIHSGKMLDPIDFDNDIASLCFNNSGDKFVVTSYQPATYFFNIQRDINKKITSYEYHDSINHEQEISSIFFDRYNNVLGVTLQELNKINIINIAENRKITSFNHNNWIKLGSVSQSKKYFATGSGNNQARLFDIYKGEQICTFPLQGSATALAFSKNETLIAIASNKPKLHIFNLKTFQEVVSFEHKKYISTICFSPSGKTLVFGSFDGKVYILKRK